MDESAFQKWTYPKPKCDKMCCDFVSRFDFTLMMLFIIKDGYTWFQNNKEIENSKLACKVLKSNK
jgi:hypothetical protein